MKGYVNPFGEVIPKTVHEDGEQSLRLLIELFDGKWKEEYLDRYKLEDVEERTEKSKSNEVTKWRPINEQ
jgi:hypothetical protein